MTTTPEYEGNSEDMNKARSARYGAQDEARPDTRDGTRDSRALQKQFSRLLSRPEAASVLRHLHRITRERLLGPDVSEATLRYMEGQKAILAYMERMAADGNNPPAMSPLEYAQTGD